MYRLISQINPVGQGEHRWGWPKVVRALRALDTGAGVLLDDFAERSLLYPSSKRRDPIRTPWIGIFHVPTIDHPVFPPDHFLRRRFEGSLWRFSKEHLVAAISLSDHAARGYRAELSCPIHVLQHPSAASRIRFDPRKFAQTKPRKLIQVGAHLRNLEAIHQAPVVRNYAYLKLVPTAPWVKRYETRVRDYWIQVNERRRTNGVSVRELPPLAPNDYDHVLSESIVLSEFFDASASNLILECIMRNTPILVNRHAAVVEYLGEGYPLYFDNIGSIAGLLSLERVIEAHRYICQLPKERFKPKTFLRGVLEVCRTYA